MAMKIIDEYKKATAPEEIVEESMYKKRLSMCMDCKYLNQGVCIKCGAYVEARMYRKSGRCPLNII